MNTTKELENESDSLKYGNCLGNKLLLKAIKRGAPSPLNPVSLHERRSLQDSKTEEKS